MADEEYSGSFGIGGSLRLGQGANSIRLEAGGTPSAPQLLVGNSTVASAAVGGSTYAARQSAQMTAQGYYAEDYPRGVVTSNGILTSGVVYFMSIGLAAGDVVTNVVTMCSGTIVTPSGVGTKVGIYSKAGVRLAQSGDVSGQFASNGAKTLPLSSPYTVPTTDGYYIAVISIAVTPPTLLRAGQTLAGLDAFTGGTLNVFGNQNAQTDLPAPATIVTTGTIGYWAGVS